jgi:hypothetical protein
MAQKKIRNPVAQAMKERYGNLDPVMRDRRERRPNDRKNSWQKDLDLDDDEE